MTSVRRSPATEAAPFSLSSDKVRVAVRLRPGASHDRIEGWVSDADGQVRLAAKVCAAPEKGRANAALVKLLAKTWRVQAGTVAVAGGATSRNKLIEIDGDAALLARLQAWGESQ